MQNSENVKQELSWQRTGAEPVELSQARLANRAFDGGGVYVIWHGPNKQKESKVVYVGQTSEFRVRFATHGNDPRIQKYAKYMLFVEWAPVPAALGDGIEAFLAKVLTPLVGDRHPDADPISVNLPW